MRKLYGSDGFFDWVEQTDALYEKDWGPDHGGRTRFEHLERALCDLRCAKRPLVGDLNRVTPTKKGIWKVHCPGLRVFGWFAGPHEFIAVCGAFTKNTHGAGSLVGRIRNDVAAFIHDNRLHKTVFLGDRSALFR